MRISFTTLRTTRAFNRNFMFAAGKRLYFFKILGFGNCNHFIYPNTDSLQKL